MKTSPDPQYCGSGDGSLLENLAICFDHMPPEKGQPDASGFSVLMAPGAAMSMSLHEDAQPDFLAAPTAPGAAVLMSPHVVAHDAAHEDSEPTAPGAAAEAPEQQVSPVEQHCVSPSWL